MRQHGPLITELLERIDNSHLSDRKVSMLATDTPDTVRNMRRGANPRLDTLDRICRSLGLEVHLEPSRNVAPASRSASIRKTLFDKTTILPVRTWNGVSTDGTLTEARETGTAPAPNGWNDPHGFYAIPRNAHLEIAGIEDGDACLVSPATALPVDARAWFRKLDGSETIGWVAGVTTDGFQLVRYAPDAEDRTATPVPQVVTIRRNEINERGAILAVFETVPTGEGPLEPEPPWIPDAASWLWQSSFINGNPTLRTVIDSMEHPIARLDSIVDMLRKLREDGAISAAETRRIHDAIETVVRRTIEILRTSPEQTAEDTAKGRNEARGQTA